MQNRDKHRHLCSYVIAAADGHVGMAKSNLFGGAEAWQMVVMATNGIDARHGVEGVQRQVRVL